MCTNIVVSTSVEGAGFGRQGWFGVNRATVAYDHPLRVDREHAVMLDFVDAGGGVEARVGVELTLESARALAEAILRACAEGEAWEQEARRWQPPARFRMPRA
ncbi:DUF6295 family protein [Tepidiforma sp.]|uniref:DUF6295 family protein n=1 Tax=Tepidiforma sp. TaxID=2682230 RepID=UPI002ADE6B64|nr:DUF6295 family protein [Tepidiforma sp.]